MKLRGLLVASAILVLIGSGQIGTAQTLAPAPKALGTVLPDPPRVNLAAAWRCQNWTDRKGDGSCVHASTVMALHYAGYHNTARTWRATHAGACDAERLENGLNAAGVPFQRTYTGDVSFLDRALAAGRPCVIWWEGATHCVLLVHLDSKRAAICDPNCAHHQHWLTREQFIREWHHPKARYAMTVLSAPPPYPKRRLPNARFSAFILLRSPIVVRP